MARPLRAGDLRNMVRIEAPGEATDAIGGRPEPWTTFIPIWDCSKETPTGAERVASMQPESRYTHILRGRWVEGITSAMRLVDEDGVVLNIRSVVDPDGRREQLEIRVEEVR